MNRIIKEETWRSVAVFFFALLLTLFLLAKIDLPRIFFTIFGIPLLIVTIHFMIKIYIRRNETSKPRKWSTRIIVKCLCLISIIYVIFGLGGISLYGMTEAVIIWLVVWSLLSIMSLVWYYKLKKQIRRII